MKILYCSNEQLLPLLGGGSAGNLRIMEAFVAAGHEVTVTTPLYIDKKPIEAKYGIRMKPFSPFPMHRTLSLRIPRYIAYSLLFVGHIQRLLWQDRYDLIFVRNCILGPAVYLGRALFGVPVMISMTDLIAGFLYEGGLPEPVVDAMVATERRLALTADHLFVITDEIKDDILSAVPETKRNEAADKVTVTYDGVDTRVFDPSRFTNEDRQKLRKELGITGPLVMYHGVIDPYHGIQVMEEVIGKALKETDLSFLLIAKGEGYEQLKRDISSDRVVCLDFIPYEEIPRYIYAADAGMIPYLPNFNLDKVFTLKLLEYLALGTNTVGFPLKAVERTFGDKPYMQIVPDAEAFVGALQSAVQQPRSEEAVKMIQGEFSWDAVCGKIVETAERNLLGTVS